MPRKTSKTPAPDPLGLTLDEYAAQIDGYLGRETGMATAVRTYRRASDVIAYTKSDAELRKGLDTKIAAMVASGEGWYQRQRVQAVKRGGHARLAVGSAAVAKAHPELWLASKVASPVMAVKYPDNLAPPYHTGKLHLFPQVWEAVAEVKRMNAEASKQAEAARELMKAVFLEVEDVWAPGDLKLTTDNWTLGWTVQERFNEARCRERAAEQGIDLAPLEELRAVSSFTSYELVANEEDAMADFCAD